VELRSAAANSNLYSAVSTQSNLLAVRIRGNCEGKRTNGWSRAESAWVSARK